MKAALIAVALLAAVSAALAPPGSRSSSSRQPHLRTHATGQSSRHQHHRSLGAKKNDFTEAKSLLTGLLDLIYNRYELHDDELNGFFFAPQTFGEHSWDVWKYRFAKKIVHGQDPYIMTFGGSSVTAGHDNKPNSSYPGIVKKRLTPVFEALGVEFRLHNIAQGANGCWPYETLYETMGELDPDFVGWEQSYNCGHDMPSFTYTTRVAAMSRRRGSVYFSASGAWLPNDRNLSQFSPPYCAEEWTVDSVQAPHAPLTHWTPTHEDILAMKAKHDAYDKGHRSYARFFPMEYYQALAPSGFNVWEGNPLAKTRSVSGVVKKGITAAAGGEKDSAVRFFTKEAARFDNPGGGGARHHPSKAFHMWRGEEIVWLHALTLMDAIYMVEADLKAGKSNADLYKEYAAAMESLQGPVPPPPEFGKLCNTPGLHCDHKAIAYTDYSPLSQLNRTLTGIVVGKTEWLEDSALYKGEVPGPDFATERFALERKPSYNNEGKAGEIYLKIATGVTGWVVLCGAKLESLKHTTMTFDLHAAEDEKLDLKEYSFANRLRANPPPLQVWTDRRYVAQECTELSQVPLGVHILGISRNETVKKDHVNSLIHVITW